LPYGGQITEFPEKRLSLLVSWILVDEFAIKGLIAYFNWMILQLRAVSGLFQGYIIHGYYELFIMIMARTL
jgi:hypothetical protein